MLFLKKHIPLLDQVEVNQIRGTTSISLIGNALRTRFEGRIQMWEVDLPVSVYLYLKYMHLEHMCQNYKYLKYLK